MTAHEQQALATRFVPRIRKMARGICRQLPAHVDAEDLAQAGMIGMLSALRSFDPSRGDCVEVYVSRRIRGAILDELRALDPLSRDQRKDARTLARANRDLEAALGRPPTEDELAEAARVTVARVRVLRELSQATLPLPLEGAALERECSVTDPVEKLAKEKLTAHLVSAVLGLGERARLVISLYYVEGMSLKEIGQLLGVTESRVCQIHGAAVRKLRGAMVPN